MASKFSKNEFIAFSFAMEKIRKKQTEYTWKDVAKYVKQHYPNKVGLAVTNTTDIVVKVLDGWYNKLRRKRVA